MAPSLPTSDAAGLRASSMGKISSAIGQRMLERRQRFKETAAERMAILGGYVAFVAATLIALAASDAKFPTKWTAVALLAVSLPFHVAHLLVDRTLVSIQGYSNNPFRGLLILLGFGCSVAGIGFMAAGESWWAGALFAVAVPAAVAISIAAILGDWGPIAREAKRTLREHEQQVERSQAPDKNKPGEKAVKWPRGRR